jgi:GntR family transcriptional regulator
MSKGSLPLYKEVRNHLVARLAEGLWRPGDLMPSEPKLAEMFGVGISTIRQAIHDLESDDVLIRRQGKGTFVALHSNPQRAGQFHSLVAEDGSKEIPFRSLLSAKRVVASRQIAERLAIKPRSGRAVVYRFKFLSSLSSQPIIVTEVTLPTSLFPRLSRASFPNGSELLYSIFQTKFHVNVIRIEEELTAVSVDAGCAKLLRVPCNSPILKIERVAYTFGGVAVEFRESWVKTSHIRYHREQGTAY